MRQLLKSVMRERALRQYTTPASLYTMGHSAEEARARFERRLREMAEDGVELAAADGPPGAWLDESPFRLPTDPRHRYGYRGVVALRLAARP